MGLPGMTSSSRFRLSLLPVVLAGTLLLLVTLVELQRGLINHDVAGHLVAARRVLAGESLYTDYLEMNPPLIIGLYLPAALLAAGMSVPLVMAARLLALLIIGLSLALSWPCWAVFCPGLRPGKRGRRALACCRRFSGSPVPISASGSICMSSWFFRICWPGVSPVCCAGRRCWWPGWWLPTALPWAS